MSLELDALDRLAASAFDGYLVRKDLVRKYSRQYPLPTYVVEFLLGRYCASTNEEEIREGLAIVEKQLQDRTVRTGEEELFKARAKEQHTIRIIDLVKARLDTRNDCYVAELPSLALRDISIGDELVRDNQRMLTDGFYAEVNLSYDGIVAQENGRPFRIESLRPIQMSKSDVLDVLAAGREEFTTEEWKALLIRSIGLEPAVLDERARRLAILRMVPFVERNYNFVELGPRGTGKSHFCEALGHVAVDKGQSVIWLSVEDLGILVRRHRLDDSVPRGMAPLLRADLVVVDDIGLLPISADAAEGLYRLVDAAYERRSIALSSNLHPSGFDELMPATIATALVDRLMHHAHVVVTTGDSIRLSDATSGKGVVPLGS